MSEEQFQLQQQCVVSEPQETQQAASASPTQEEHPLFNPLKALVKHIGFTPGRFCRSHNLNYHVYLNVLQGIPEHLPARVKAIFREHDINAAQADRDYQAWRNWHRQNPPRLPK